jgi:hypothetical protein
MNLALARIFTHRAETAHLLLGYAALIAACLSLPLVARAEIERRAQADVAASITASGEADSASADAR